MLLYEITDQERVLKLITMSKYIEHMLKNEKHDLKPWMTDKNAFLEFLSDNDIPISDSELDTIVANKSGPLGKIIDNIQGDEIVWTGQAEETEMQDAEIEAGQQNAQDEKIVANMAQQALPK